MFKKNTIIIFFLVAVISKLNAQCVLVPLSLAERVKASTLIVEGKVSGLKSYWNSDKNMIYTANAIKVSKVYKGAQLLPANQFNIITLGGNVGTQAIKVEPELELEYGDIGIFLLIEKNGEWVAESGPQGFIKIDKIDGTSSDVFNQYAAFSIYSKIENLIGNKAIDINAALTKVMISSKRAACTISSISPTTITAGTTSILTIKGTNFKSTRDTSSVQFKNADDGGGSYIKALQLDYTSWSDTMIKVIVRTKAGTGKIRVVIGGNSSAISTDTLKISYAHLNVESGFKRDSVGYETQEIGMNANNGITWKMSTRFFDSSAARGAFIRSLERWRCGTYINWDTLGKVKYNKIAGDGVNICAWDTSGAMANGVLAQCFSYWGGCFTPGLKYYVNELDIRFRVRPTNTTNWNYTTGNASGSQFHFESVAVHELGHGHQMGHVIAPSVVMHYAIANGQTKPGLSTSDIDCGNYVITKSGTAVCGKNKHTKLTSGNCAIVAPVANFGASKSTICLNESSTFTDSSKGNISAYSWNFGAGATPSTAKTKGPHTVSYSTSGSKTISLTISTLNGNLSKNTTINVQADTKVKPNFTWVAAEKGKVTFTNTTNGVSSNKWFFGNGDSSTLINPTIQYNIGGTYSVKLNATNTCNTKDSTLIIKLAYLNFGAIPTAACINQPITYTDSSDNNVATWAWTFSGGTPATANTKGPHVVTYNTSGAKSATLNITVTGGQAQTYTITNATTISNDTFAKANFTYENKANNIIEFTSTSTGSNKTYKWYFGDGDSSTLKNPTHQYTNANNKSVKLVVNGTCNKDEIVIILRDFTNVSSILKSIFEVFPNPSNNQFKIQTYGTNVFDLNVSDVSGKEILHKTMSNGSTIDCSQWANGVYLVKVTDGEQSQTVKIMVQH